MDASRLLRPVGAAAAAAILLTGAACNGPARRAARQDTPTTVAPATTVAPTATTPAGTPAAAAPVRTDDLDASLKQADSDLSQTGGAVGDADQNTQQNSD